MIASLIALASLVASQPYNWQNVVIVGGGFVSGVIPHPKEKDLVYARTDIGGVYRLDKKTRHWVPIEDFLTRADWNLYGGESVALDPNDPNRVYIAAGTYTNSWAGNGAILRSQNRGETWSITDLPFKNGGNEDGRSIGERLDVDPNDGNVLFFGSRHNGLWRSGDAGVHWSQVSSFPIAPSQAGFGVGWILFDPRGGHAGLPTQTIYAGAIEKGPTLWKSIDAGQTWAPVPDQPAAASRGNLAGLLPHHARLAADGTLYVAYCDGVGPNNVSHGEVWKLNTATGAWTEITPEKTGGDNPFGYGGLCLDRAHPGTVMTSTLDRWRLVDTVFRSVDGGAHWISLKDQAVRDSTLAPFLTWADPTAKFGHWIGDVEIDPFDSDRAWYVTGAGIWTTEDLTNADRGTPTHWVPGAQGLEETAATDLISPTSGSQVISALLDVAGFRHDDLLHAAPGGMWKNPIWSSTTSLDYAGQRPNLVVRFGNNGAQSGAISHDGAASWSPLASSPSGIQGGGSGAIAADGTAIVWSPYGALPSVSTDGGTTWTACVGAPKSGRVVSDKKDPKAFYIADGGTVYASHDGGFTFAAGATVPVQNPGPLVAPFDRSGDLWLPGSDGIYRSTDGGQTFSKLNSVNSAERIGFGQAAPGSDYPAVYIIGGVHDEMGVFRSTDGGVSWVRINDDRHGFGLMNEITGDPKKFGRVYLGTNGRGILYGDPAEGQGKAN